MLTGELGSLAHTISATDEALRSLLDGFNVDLPLHPDSDQALFLLPSLSPASAFPSLDSGLQQQVAQQGPRWALPLPQGLAAALKGGPGAASALPSLHSLAPLIPPPTSLKTSAAAAGAAGGAVPGSSGGGGSGTPQQLLAGCQLSLERTASFTIPAYKRLTHQDIIHTDDLDDPSAAFVGSFGELADLGKLGALPSDEELRLQLWENEPQLEWPDALGPAPAQPYSGIAAQLHPHQAVAAPAGAALRHAPFGLAPLRLRQQSLPAAGAAGWREGDEGGSGTPASARSSRGGMASRQSSLGSLKRRLDNVGLEDPGSARSKRSNSSVAWGEAAAQGSGSSEEEATPHSAPGHPGARSRFSTEAARRPVRARRRLRLAAASSSEAEEEEESNEEEEEEEERRVRRRPSAAAAERRPSGSGVERKAGGRPPNATSVYRGVSRHRLTQRWEASLWLNGRQLYLGGFDSQEDAARAYDLAALACKGPEAVINFAPAEYTEQLREVQTFTREEVVAFVRRRSSAFSRGKSRYRGVSGHNGRWEARIGAYLGRKNVSFGVFDSEEDAARQYDRALILEKGRGAKTNFPLTDYEREAAEFEAHLLRTCGTTEGPAIAEEVEEYTLPRHRPATADERKRHAVVYADSLRRVLRQTV